MFSYFLKLFVCLCVCVRVCVCMRAWKWRRFQFLVTLCGVCFHCLCCGVMLCQFVRCQAAHPSPCIFISVGLHGCDRVLLLYCHGYFHFLVASQSPPMKRNNVLSPNSAPQSGRCRRLLWPCRPHFGEHSVIKGTLLVSDNMHFVGCVGNARLGLLVKYLTSYI